MAILGINAGEFWDELNKIIKLPTNCFECTIYIKTDAPVIIEAGCWAKKGDNFVMDEDGTGLLKVKKRYKLVELPAGDGDDG